MKHHICHVLLTITHGDVAPSNLHEHAANRTYPIQGVMNCSGIAVPKHFADAAGSESLLAVLTERARQLGKGYYSTHDDARDMLEMAKIVQGFLPKPECNCFESEGVVIREDCVKAAAVLLAMIERFDREAARAALV